MKAINSEATRQIKVSVIRNKTIKKKKKKKSLVAAKESLENLYQTPNKYKIKQMILLGEGVMYLYKSWTFLKASSSVTIDIICSIKSNRQDT